MSALATSLATRTGSPCRGCLAAWCGASARRSTRQLRASPNCHTPKERPAIRVPQARIVVSRGHRPDPPAAVVVLSTSFAGSHADGRSDRAGELRRGGSLDQRTGSTETPGLAGRVRTRWEQVRQTQQARPPVADHGSQVHLVEPTDVGVFCARRGPVRPVKMPT